MRRQVVRWAQNWQQFTIRLILQNESQAPQFIGERVEHFGAKSLKFKIKLSNEKVPCGVMLSMFSSHLPC